MSTLIRALAALHFSFVLSMFGASTLLASDHEWFKRDSFGRNILEDCAVPFRNLLATGTRLAGLWVGGRAEVQTHRFKVENVVEDRVVGSATLEVEVGASHTSCGSVQITGQPAEARSPGSMGELQGEPIGTISIDNIRVSLIEHCYESFSTLLSRGNRVESVTHYQAPNGLGQPPPWPTLTFTVSGPAVGASGRMAIVFAVVERLDWASGQIAYLHECGALSTGMLTDEPDDCEPGEPC